MKLWVGVGDVDIPHETLSSLPWNEGQPVRSFSVGVWQSWRFRMDGMLALFSARCMMSLSWWCRIDRPASHLHERLLGEYLLHQPVCHKGTRAVHRGWCRDEDPQQLWLPRCRASAHMLTVGAREANHCCGVPTLPGAALLKLSVKADMTTVLSAIIPCLHDNLWNPLASTSLLNGQVCGSHSESKPVFHSNAYHLIAQSQANWCYWRCQKPVTRMRGWCCNNACLIQVGGQSCLRSGTCICELLIHNWVMLHLLCMLWFCWWYRGTWYSGSTGHSMAWVTIWNVRECLWKDGVLECQSWCNKLVILLLLSSSSLSSPSLLLSSSSSIIIINYYYCCCYYDYF